MKVETDDEMWARRKRLLSLLRAADRKRTRTAFLPGPQR